MFTFVRNQCSTSPEYADQIADQSEQLNNKGFGDLFGNLQGYLREHMILAITKIFERPNDRYPTISLPTAIQLLTENADALVIVEPVILSRDLMKLGVSEDDLNGLEPARSHSPCCSYTS